MAQGFLEGEAVGLAVPVPADADGLDPVEPGVVSGVVGPFGTRTAFRRLLPSVQ